MTTPDNKPAPVPQWAVEAAAEIHQRLRVYCADTPAIIAKHAPQPSSELTPYMEAILSIGHWDLRYHRLLAACRAVAVSRRAFSSAQSAVLSESLDALESIMDEKPPEWPKSQPTAPTSGPKETTP